MYLSLGLLFFAIALADGFTSFFKTEPEVERNALTVVTKPDPSALAPGYFFVTRFGHGPPGVRIHGWGPEIFDSDGSLVWSGRLDLPVWYSKRLKVCNYDGTRGKHLCFHQSVKDYAFWHLGFITFVDQNYFQVVQFGQTGDVAVDWPEGHEVNTPSNCLNCLLQEVFLERQYNITHKGVTEERTVLDACFQEVDTRDRSATFEWCALDHLPASDLKYFLDTHEQRLSNPKFNKLDLWHLNGVDRNDNGDYLISLRWIDAIIKIAGKNSANPGSILWRLGPHGTYPQDFVFAGQHTGRFVDATDSTETISFFNNGWQNGQQPKVVNMSAGYLVEVNHAAKMARLVQSFDSPGGELSPDRGSMHMLPNGNAVVGWGKRPHFTEFGPDGRVLLDIKFNEGASEQAWKQEWVGRPLTKPKVIAYAQECANVAVFGYASWNGATEVRQWRFWGGDAASVDDESWNVLATVEKDGFETQAKLAADFVAYIMVEALDASGDILDTSEAVPLFVPSLEMKTNCDRVGCQKPAKFNYLDKKKSRWNHCRQQKPWDRVGSESLGYYVPALLLLVAFVETCSWLLHHLIFTTGPKFGDAKLATGG